MSHSRQILREPHETRFIDARGVDTGDEENSAPALVKRSIRASRQRAAAPRNRRPRQRADRLEFPLRDRAYRSLQTGGFDDEGRAALIWPRRDACGYDSAGDDRERDSSGAKNGGCPRSTGIITA
jgi:hypothetical protein